MNAGVGHNGGPVLEGTGWQRHCWTRARAKLLPRLPVEVIRGRVKRAAEIGLDYSTYATVRASTGRDIVAFLFSSNALRLFRAEQKLAADRAEKLSAMVACRRGALAVAPLSPGDILLGQGVPLDTAHAAPAHLSSFSQAARVLDAARGKGLPADGVVLVGDLGLERDWVAAGRLAGYLDSSRFFAGTAG